MAAETEEELDYIDDDDEIENNGVFRWLQAGVVLFALGGFFGLAWYAYKSGEGTDDKDVEVIKVEKNPVKEAPANPGGMQIPNQDKTVYGLINGGKTEKPVVERIVPPTEEPEHDTETSTWTSAKKADTAPADAPKIKETTAASTPKKAEQFDPSKAKAAKPAAVKASPSVAMTQAAEPMPETQAAKNDTPATSPMPEKPQVQASDVQEVQEKPVAAVAVKKAEPPSAHAEAIPQKAAAQTQSAASPAATAPKLRIQLGALKSETEAEKTWSKIAAQFPEALGSKQHYIIRVNVKGSTFYRLQAAPFETTKEADATCMTLVSGGQGCFLAKVK